MHKKEEQAINTIDEFSKAINDKSTNQFRRVRYAEQHRKDYALSQKSVITMLGVGHSTYYGTLFILKSGRQDIIDEVANGKLTIHAGVNMLKGNKRNSLSHITAPSDTTILYEDSKAILYVCDGRPILKIGKVSAELDNYPYAVDTVLRLLTSGYKIRSGDMWVLSPEGQSCGSLKHHILAAYAGIELVEAMREPVHLVEKSKDSCINLRVDNMLCHSVPTKKLYSVVRQKDKIIVSYTGRSKSHKIIWHTDYSGDLYNILQSPWLHIRPKARDKRLCANIAGSEYYLYHLRMAVHLYKPKIDKDCVLEAISQFKINYLDKGLTIDHLDNDIANNLMSNLIIMSKLNNQEKEGLYRKFRNLSTKRHFIFCRIRRYDDDSVTIQAGCCTNFGEPEYLLNGAEVIPISSIIDRLRAFLDWIMDREKWSGREDQ